MERITIEEREIDGARFSIRKMTTNHPVIEVPDVRDTERIAEAVEEIERVQAACHELREVQHG